MVATAEARPTQLTKTDDGEFLDFGYVPVWCEHTRPDGVPVGREDLERVAAANNSRIDETGDFCPAVIGHRKDPDDPNSQGHDNPEVVGYFGPYRMGEIGKKNKKAAVFARMRIYKEDAEKVKKNPRLSVEYYPSDDYFDPISLLGAETPQLDLGLHYSRNGGRRVIRYSRALQYGAFPGGSNTFVPSAGMDNDEDEKPISYSQESTSMLTPEDIQAIAAALEPIIDAKIEQRLGLSTDPTSDPNAMAQAADPAAAMPLDTAAAPVIAEGAAPPPVADAATPPPVVADDEEKEKAQKFQRDETEKLQYARQLNDLRIQYKRLEDRNTTLEAEAIAAKSEGKKAIRYQRLKELEGEGYQLNPDEEIAEVLELDDARFEKHCERIVNRYSRVPLKGLPGTHGKAEQFIRDDNAEQYSKRAKEIAQARVEKGEDPDYPAALEQAKKEIAAKPKAVSAAA